MSQAAQKCPVTSAYPIDHGRHCCESKWVIDDSGIDSACDRGLTSPSKPLACGIVCTPCADPRYPCYSGVPQGRQLQLFITIFISFYFYNSTANLSCRQTSCHQLW